MLKGCFGDEIVKDFFCVDIPPGGVEKKDNRKTIVNRKRKDNRADKRVNGASSCTIAICARIL